VRPAAGGATRRTTRPALLLDRDGTIVRDAHYLRAPSQLEILPGVVDALRRFQAAGWALVVVTNQSGIARGMFTEAEYAVVRDALAAMLAREGVTLDATFHCPHHPDVSPPCACRKPGTLLFEQARDALGLDLTRSVLVGDRWRDIAAAPVLGARGILVPGVETPDEDLQRARREAEVADGLVALSEMVLDA
jgi:histidinol-phosphate phosphatase family protein